MLEEKVSGRVHSYILFSSAKIHFFPTTVASLPTQQETLM